jgi:hypothetical protein
MPIKHAAQCPLVIAPDIRGSVVQLLSSFTWMVFTSLAK